MHKLGSVGRASSSHPDRSVRQLHRYDGLFSTWSPIGIALVRPGTREGDFEYVLSLIAICDVHFCERCTVSELSRSDFASGTLTKGSVREAKRCLDFGVHRCRSSNVSSPATFAGRTHVRRLPHARAHVRGVGPLALGSHDGGLAACDRAVLGMVAWRRVTGRKGGKGKLEWWMLAGEAVRRTHLMSSICLRNPQGAPLRNAQPQCDRSLPPVAT